MMYSACKLNRQGDNIQPWRTPFPIWNQSVVPCPVLAVASWPAYVFFRSQIRWFDIPISLRISQFAVIHTVRGSCEIVCVSNKVAWMTIYSVQKRCEVSEEVLGSLTANDEIDCHQPRVKEPLPSPNMAQDSSLSPSWGPEKKQRPVVSGAWSEAPLTVEPWISCPPTTETPRGELPSPGSSPAAVSWELCAWLRWTVFITFFSRKWNLMSLKNPLHSRDIRSRALWGQEVPGSHTDFES